MATKKTKMTEMSEEQDRQMRDWLREEHARTYKVEERYPLITRGILGEQNKQEEQQGIGYDKLEDIQDGTDVTGTSTTTAATKTTAPTETDTPPTIEQPEEASPARDTQAGLDSLPNGKQTIQRRVSSKQRRLSLEEYSTVFLSVPKIENSKPVFISSSIRDELDRIARRLGSRRMSASGIVENTVKHHLAFYGDDIKEWFKL